MRIGAPGEVGTELSTSVELNMRVETLKVGPLQCNCYVVYPDDGAEAAIIDPGGDASRIIQFCEGNSLSPQFIINTHAHADHVGGNPKLKERYPDAELCIGEGDRELLADSVRNLTSMLGISLDMPEPDCLLSEDDVVEFGSVSLRVLHTPGHTPGAISLVADTEPKQVFCGDLIFQGSVGRTDLPGGDWETLRSSIREKIMTLPDDTIIYPGHEGMTTVGQEKNGEGYF